ncbi:fimbrial protein [Serratia liquefaciens]|uniref:fimbrial protein n=1 Tax=Serratia liquefaciens TaxID=614 RepID=UPI00165D11CA|nr:fimbrial protein [Serratia liquefaciens]QNQ55438.1 type 1 fimbrial protein [Serratia liquefaciens]
MGNIYKYTMAFFFIFSLLSITAQAAVNTQGWGKVNMQGSIVDTACAIAVHNRDQTIDMGVIPVSDIIRDGQGRSQPFLIELVNCVLERANSKLPDWKQFQVTFEGDAEGDLFGVRGEASGVALQITDTKGDVAMPGTPLPLKDIIRDDFQLHYSLKLVANNHALKTGDYFSSIRFKLDYF